MNTSARTRTRIRTLAHANLVIATLCWGSSWVVARWLHDQMPPVAMSFWRWMIATALIAPFAWPYLKRDAARLRSNWKLLCFLGLVGTTGFSTLGYWGVNYTTATNASLLNGALPVLVIGMSALIDRAWPTRRIAAGLVLAWAEQRIWWHGVTGRHSPACNSTRVICWCCSA